MGHLHAALNTLVFSVDLHARRADRRRRAVPAVRLLRASSRGTSSPPRCASQSSRSPATRPWSRKSIFRGKSFPFSAVVGLRRGSCRGRLDRPGGLMLYYHVAPVGDSALPAGCDRRARRLHGRLRSGARDGQSLLSRRQIPVRSRHDGLDVRDLGPVSGRTVTGKLGWCVALNPMTPIIDAYRGVLLSGQLPPRRSVAPAAISVVGAARWLAFVSPGRIPVRGERLMTEPRVIFDGVWKKFRRGERHDSLRDLIPATVEAASSRGAAKPTSRSPRSSGPSRDVSFEVKRGRGARHHRPERRRQIDGAQAAHAHSQADERSLRA